MDAQAWLADYQRRIDDIQARADAARRVLVDLTGSATSTHGEVSVTVNPAGVLRGLSFGERADELSRPRLAALVLETTERARAEAVRRSREALAPVAGAVPWERFVGTAGPL